MEKPVSCRGVMPIPFYTLADHWNSGKDGKFEEKLKSEATQGVYSNSSTFKPFLD